MIKTKDLVYVNFPGPPVLMTDTNMIWKNNIIRVL